MICREKNADFRRKLDKIRIPAQKRWQKRTENIAFDAFSVHTILKLAFCEDSLKKPIFLTLFPQTVKIFGRFCPKLDKIVISSKKAKKMYQKQRKNWLFPAEKQQKANSRKTAGFKLYP